MVKKDEGRNLMQSQVHKSAILDGTTYMSVVHIKLDFQCNLMPHGSTNMVQACHETDSHEGFGVTDNQAKINRTWELYWMACSHIVHSMGM